MGDKPDQITANKAIYDPKSSVITFLGNVKVETKDNLKVSTESIAYDQNSEVAQTEAGDFFRARKRFRQSVGAVVESKTKKLELKKDVEITVEPEASEGCQSQAAKPASARSRPVTIRSAHALFEQEIDEDDLLGRRHG